MQMLCAPLEESCLEGKFLVVSHSPASLWNAVNIVAIQCSKINLSLLRARRGPDVGEAEIMQRALYFSITTPTAAQTLLKSQINVDSHSMISWGFGFLVGETQDLRSVDVSPGLLCPKHSLFWNWAEHLKASSYREPLPWPAERDSFCLWLLAPGSSWAHQNKGSL